MVRIRGYEQLRGISHFWDHFSMVARGRKFCVVVLFYVGSSYVVLCCLVPVCGIQYLLLLLYRFVSHEGTEALFEVAC